MKTDLSLFFICLCFSLLFGCNKEDEQKGPKVQTLECSITSDNSIILNGIVSNENGSPVIARGFYWSALPNVDITDSLLSSGIGLGDFSAQLGWLPNARTFYYKAFATNSLGTAYGDELSFRTKEIPAIADFYESGYNYLDGKAYIRYRIVEGSMPFSSHGICYSLEPTPTISSYIKEVSTNSGMFFIEIDNLLVQQYYYMRIFIRDNNGVHYSSEEVRVNTYKPGPSLYLKEGNGFVSNDTTISVFSPIKIGVIGKDDVGSGNHLERFKFSIISNNVPAIFVDSTFSSSDFVWQDFLIFDIAGDGILKCELWDEAGLKASQEIIITVINRK